MNRACTIVRGALLSLFAATAWADAADPDPVEALDAIELRILAADTLRERIDQVRRYVAQAKKVVEHTPNEADRQRIADTLAKAAANDVELAAKVGRYNIIICPPGICAKTDAIDMLPLLDVSYVLLKRLFAFDPVAEKGYRVIHRYDHTRARRASSHWRGLWCLYGREDWAEWVASENEWTGNPIHELTHCFAGNSPARHAIESLPGSGEGWPKWTPLYVYDHLPDYVPMASSIDRLKRQYVGALERDLRRHGDFWFIGPYDPSGGLLCELIDACAKANPRDPHAAVTAALRHVNQTPDPLLRHHYASEFLRLTSTWESHAPREFWRVLKRAGCGLCRKDVDSYAYWVERVTPPLMRIRGELSPADLRDAVEEAATAIRRISKRTAFSHDLREQAWLVLSERLVDLGHLDLAREIAAERDFALNWAYLGPFQAQDGTQRPLDVVFINEQSRTRAELADHLPPRVRWRDDELSPLVAVHDMGRLMGERAGDVIYAWTTIHVRKPRRHYACISSDDAARIWLNGRRLERGDVAHNGVNRATRHVVRLDFTGRENTMLVKVHNAGGPTGFYVRLMPDLSD